METLVFIADRALEITRSSSPLALEGATLPLVEALDSHLGALFASTYEVPGRYTRWDVGSQDPPLRFGATGRTFTLDALNARGEQLLAIFAPALRQLELPVTCDQAQQFSGVVPASKQDFTEEERSRQPSVLTVLRQLLTVVSSPQDSLLGWYGAFGYDLAFQFEPIVEHLTRPPKHRDMVLYFPDRLLVVDHRTELAQRVEYDFALNGHFTHGLPREGQVVAFAGARQPARARDHSPGEYADCVRQALGAFGRGELFETVPGQTFFEPCLLPPSELFARLSDRNPSPYGALLNLGDGEYLIAASPEMFVRVEGDRVETCPIAGTITRGADALVRCSGAGSWSCTHA